MKKHHLDGMHMAHKQATLIALNIIKEHGPINVWENFIEKAEKTAFFEHMRYFSHSSGQHYSHREDWQDRVVYFFEFLGGYEPKPITVKDNVVSITDSGLVLLEELTHHVPMSYDEESMLKKLEQLSKHFKKEGVDSVRVLEYYLAQCKQKAVGELGTKI